MANIHMRFFIALLLLLGGFISAHADTTGTYHVLLHGREVASANEWSTIDIHLDAAKLSATDTLFISYWSCGPRPADNQSLVVLDSAAKKEVLKAGFKGADYILPLKELLLYRDAHPGTVFAGTFVSTSRYSKHTIRFRLVIT